MKYYGWYSDKMDATIGHAIYLTPEGKQVLITTVTDSRTNHYTQWKDMTFVGEVTEFIHSHKRLFPRIEMEYKFIKQEQPYENFPGRWGGKRPYSRFNQ